jgi:hypothetical protein
VVCALGKPTKPASTAPPSQDLLNAFAILQRPPQPGDALPAEALTALKRMNLAPADPASARLLRTGPGGGKAWVVPVPDVSRPFPVPCAVKIVPQGIKGPAPATPKTKEPTPREGLAVVAIGDAAPGGGGALKDLVRGRAPVWVDPCAGQDRTMLSVSGIVPNGVSAAYLTAPDGTAVKADVKDNGYEFLIPRPRTFEQRYVVWTGGDGTPHVQPVTAVASLGVRGCPKPRSSLAKMPKVTPTSAFRVCSPARPFGLVPRPVPRVKKGTKVVVRPTPLPVGVVLLGCATGAVPYAGTEIAPPAALPVPATPAPAPARKHR